VVPVEGARKGVPGLTDLCRDQPQSLPDTVARAEGTRSQHALPAAGAAWRAPGAGKQNAPKKAGRTLMIAEEMHHAQSAMRRKMKKSLKRAL
jgi:hypothetical protein